MLDDKGPVELNTFVSGQKMWAKNVGKKCGHSDATPMLIFIAYANTQKYILITLLEFPLFLTHLSII